MTKVKNITEQELAEMQRIGQASSRNMQQLGDLHLQLRAAKATVMSIENRVKEVEVESDSLNEDAKALNKLLLEKYGKVNVNLQTGEISE